MLCYAPEHEHANISRYCRQSDSDNGKLYKYVCITIKLPHSYSIVLTQCSSKHSTK